MARKGRFDPSSPHSAVVRVCNFATYPNAQMRTNKELEVVSYMVQAFGKAKARPIEAAFYGVLAGAQVGTQTPHTIYETASRV